MVSLSVFDALRHAVELRLAEVDALPQGVQTWMVFMRSMFLSSILFAYWKKEARVVLAMALTTAILLLGIKSVFPEIHSGQIGQVIHIFVWTPAFIYLISKRSIFMAEIRSRSIPSILYGLWAFLIMGILLVSLGIDYPSVFKNFIGLL